MYVNKFTSNCPDHVVLPELMSRLKLQRPSSTRLEAPPPQCNAWLTLPFHPVWLKAKLGVVHFSSTAAVQFTGFFLCVEIQNRHIMAARWGTSRKFIEKYSFMMLSGLGRFWLGPVVVPCVCGLDPRGLHRRVS